MLPKTEQVRGEVVYEPATAAAGFGPTFSVGTHSKVCRLTTDTDDDAGADDAFTLYTVLEFVQDTGVPVISYALAEKDPIGGTTYPLVLGGNMTQAEIVIRGNYAWKKTVITTPAIGIEAFDGYERR